MNKIEKGTSIPIQLRSDQKITEGYESFQADFWRLNGDLAKRYGHHKFWDIDLGVPEVRDWIINRELICLAMLAPSLEARKANVILPEGKMDTAIIMKNLPPDSFLSDKVDNEEYIPDEVWQKVASRIIDFHFDENSCPRAEITLRTLLKYLIDNETKILTRKFPDGQEEYKRAQQIAQEYYQKHKYNIFDFGKALGEPIMSHGDLEIPNIALLDGEINIIDPAPKPEWQTNERRMGAMFLKVDLELRGLEDAADTFWTEYTSLYAKECCERGIDFHDSAVLQEGMESLDLLSEWYRLTIFLRLAKNAENEELVERCEERLNLVLEKMEES